MHLTRQFGSDSHGQTLVSSGGITELNFFSLGNSTRKYLGIWFTNVSTYTIGLRRYP